MNTRNLTPQYHRQVICMALQSDSRRVKVSGAIPPGKTEGTLPSIMPLFNFLYVIRINSDFVV